MANARRRVTHKLARGAAILASKPMRLRVAAAGAILAVTAILGAASLPGALAAPERPVSAMTADGVIESVESEYNNIYVIKQGKLLYMNFGYRGSQYVESVYDLLDPTALSAEYTQYMTLAAAYAEKLERAAFVGLGGGRTATYLVRSFPELKMDVAELDPEVIRLAKKYFGALENERLKIHAQDGRIFLTRSRATYDAVFRYNKENAKNGVEPMPSSWSPAATSSTRRATSP